MSEDNWTVIRVDALPKCDFCTQKARYEGKTTQGPWAYMCGAHYSIYGMGLGLGVGQYLKLRDEP